MKRIATVAAIIGSVTLFGVMVAAMAKNNNPGSPGDNCSHGNSDKECKDDPQPSHGKDCDDHGKARGNEDHCEGDHTSSPPSSSTTKGPPPSTEVPVFPTSAALALGTVGALGGAVVMLRRKG